MNCGKFGWSQLLFGLLILAGCDDDGGATERRDTEETEVDSDADAESTEEIVVSNQTVELTTEIVVDSLSVQTDRLVVVSDSESDVIGSTVVSSDPVSDVSIGLVRRLSDGEMLAVRLHQDGGDDGVFTSMEDDPPLDGVAEESFEVSVPEGAPDIRFVYEGGVPDYRVNVQPESFSGDIDSLFDPIVTLRSGWRYEIDNRVFGSHPWEIIDGDGNELLSQNDEGTLEGGTEVGWEDSGGVSQFTVSDSISTQASDYRCSRHPMSMTGGVEFID